MIIQLVFYFELYNYNNNFETNLETKKKRKRFFKKKHGKLVVYVKIHFLIIIFICVLGFMCEYLLINIEI
jgi:hypothetical protein